MCTPSSFFVMVYSQYNSKFFSSMSNKACYWAGFIAADGCITTSGNTKYLQINVADKDRQHLQKLVLDVGGKNIVVRTYPPAPKSKSQQKIARISFRLYPHDVAILKDIFSITESKTYNLSFPELDTFEQQLSFIVGFIDGDGCVSRNKVGYRVDVNTASPVFLQGVKIFFDTKYPKLSATGGNASIHTRKLSTGTSFYGYCPVGSRLIPFILDVDNYLGNTILARKWEKAITYAKENKDKKPCVRTLTLQQFTSIKALIERGVSNKEISTVLSIPIWTVERVKYKKYNYDYVSDTTFQTAGGDPRANS